MQNFKQIKIQKLKKKKNAYFIMFNSVGNDLQYNFLQIKFFFIKNGIGIFKNAPFKLKNLSKLVNVTKGNRNFMKNIQN